MTKRWKSKINSFNTLLVLITLMLVNTERAAAESPQVTNTLDSTDQQTHIYVGNDEIAHYFFGSSVSNNSFILQDLRECLDTFRLFTCMKMLLLSRINDVKSLMEDPSLSQRDLHVLNGLLTLKVKNATAGSDSKETSDDLSLDEEIARKLQRMFSRRSLSVNFHPKMKIEIEPSGNFKDDFLCFRYAIHRDEDRSAIEGRRKKGMSMMMLVPPLIMLGLMPFTLASIKAMVMNAVMINMMALNGAIFMTIRNLVFGPRRGDNVKYVNYGYSKDRQTQSRRPVLIIHSPAAFVKQPPVHRHRRPSGPHSAHSHQAGPYRSEGDLGDQYFFIQEGDYGYGGESGHNGVHRRANIRTREY